MRKFFPLAVSALAAISFSAFAADTPKASKTDNDPTVQGSGNAKMQNKADRHAARTDANANASAGASSDKPAKPKKAKKAKMKDKASSGSSAVPADSTKADTSAGSPGGK